MKDTIKSMNERGIGTLYGRWLIEGAPRVLLFDTGSAYKYLDEWKGDLWAIAGIPSPPSDGESNEAIVFGYLIAWFLGEVRFWNVLGLLPANQFHSTFSMKRSEPLLYSFTSGCQA